MWDGMLAKAKRLGLEMRGVSFHVGSGCTRIGSFTKALTDAKKIFQLAQK